MNTLEEPPVWHRPIQSWKDMPAVIDGRPAEFTTVAYGGSLSLCSRGREIWVDFGNDFGAIALAKITFRNPQDALACYCKGIRLDLKAVEHPTHPCQ